MNNDNQHYLEPASRPNWSWSSRPGEAPQEPQITYDLPDDDESPLYVISVAADLADLHPQTLRAYEREGLITPARTQGGTRRYSQRDVERLKFIRTLTQDEGLNIAGVRIVLDLGEKLERTRQRVSELEQMVRTLADRLEQRGSSQYDIVKSSPAAVEVHPLRRRTGQRSTAATRPGSQRTQNVQRARPVPPPESRVSH